MDKTLFDVIRSQKLAAAPEEIIRQKLVRLLLNKGYPKSLILIEQKISKLPHIHKQFGSLPDRRIDILVYCKEMAFQNEDIFPLLLIECKAVPLTRKVFRQAAGYNYYIKAPFFALANSSECIIGWHPKEASFLQYFTGLPDYEELLKLYKNSQ
ncbi:MAG: type I restriction enzyme HsdR N-terminal domain-containing protein [Simkaniaceae bacterium]